MKINEIILGTVNEKGYERNFICTFETFVKKYMPSACENYWEVAEIITELEKVKEKGDACCEMYFSPNETMYVRYCKSISDLELFITGRYNETECEFYYELCDEKCMEILDRLGISIKDEKIKRPYPHYEKIEREYEPNEKRMYQVEIEERLARTIEVEAKSMDEATDIVNEQYYKEEIVLDAEDMKDVNLKVVGSRALTREKSR